MFGGINIYLIGDLCQLPPVGGRPLYATEPVTELEKQGKLVFQNFTTVLLLTLSMRRTDNQFRYSTYL